MRKKICRVCYKEATHKYVKFEESFMTRNKYSRSFVKEVNVCDEHINNGFTGNLQYQSYQLKKIESD